MKVVGSISGCWGSVAKLFKAVFIGLTMSSEAFLWLGTQAGPGPTLCVESLALSLPVSGFLQNTFHW